MATKENLHIVSANLNSSPLIPLVSTPVTAGFPSPAEDHIDKKLDLNELLISHPASTFFVRVEGSSMQDAHIFSGDILVVDKSLSPENGKIVIAIIDGEFTVKRLKKKGDRAFLYAENPSFPPVEIKEESEMCIWGVVTYIIHKAK